jgi:hypothetical protein
MSEKTYSLLISNNLYTSLYLPPTRIHPEMFFYVVWQGISLPLHIKTYLPVLWPQGKPRQAVVHSSWLVAHSLWRGKPGKPAAA